MPDPAQTGATASPSATDGQTGAPAQTGPTNDSQTGPAQTGAAQTGPAQTGPTGASQTGPSGAAQTGPSGPTGATGAAEEVSLDKLKKAALDATAAYEKDKTPENKAAAEKAVAEAKAAMKKELGQVAPEKYDLKLPKDSVLDTAHLERIAAEAKARGLSNEEAQALVERDNGLFGVFAQEEKARVEGYIAGWLEESKNDKEIGGANFPKNAELSFRVIKKYGTPELVKFLEDTGLGNHPEAVRIFVKIGNLMGADKFEPAGAPGAPSKPLAEAFYGEEKPKQ